MYIATVHAPWYIGTPIWNYSVYFVTSCNKLVSAVS